MSTFGTGFSNPLGLAFDSNGNLFVANFGTGTIIKISAVSPPANQPPVANAGADQTVECTGPSGASVTLNGAGSSDPDGDTLTYTWREGNTVLAGPGSSSTSQVTLSLGSHTITLTVNDGKGGTATDQVVVTVKDTTPPTVKAALVPVKVPEKDEDRNEDGKEDGEGYSGNTYQVSVSATDACDPAPVITAFIPQPLTSASVYGVKYEKGKKNVVQVQIKGNKVQVKLKGPSEQALRTLLTQAIALGGFQVTDGQVVSLISRAVENQNNKDDKEKNDKGKDEGNKGKDDDDKGVSANYLFRFDASLKLTSVSGPGTKLVAYATDASGNRSTVVEVLPVKPKAKKGQALLAKVGESDVPAPEALPTAFGLESNYPNPFNPSTTIRYALPEAANVRLVIYNILGQEVKTLVDASQAAGRYSVIWDGRDEAGRLAATGMYIYRLQAGGFVQVRKMLFVK